MFHGLESHPNFILWELQYDDTREEWIKAPLNYKTGLRCDPNVAENRTDAETAVKAAQQLGLNVGYHFMLDDPFFFVDIDDGIDPNTGDWRPECRAIANRFPGAFVELSQSGTGLHIIGSCDKAALPEKRRCKAHKFDTSFDSVFTDSRFVALTMRSPMGSALVNLTAPLQTLIGERLLCDTGLRETEWTDAPIEGPGLSDMDIIDKASKSNSLAQAFNGTASFVDLWNCNEAVLAEIWPPDHKSPHKVFDRSRADMALAQHLAFWTSGNCEQMERLMRMSGLAREKWDARGDYYLNRTILAAVSRAARFYTGQTKSENSPPPPPATIPTSPSDLRFREGYQLLSAHQQAALFAGCVYVRSIHKVLLPDGDLVGPEAFKAYFGGYVFSLDALDKTTTNAFTAFTESQQVEFPKVRDMFFDPDGLPLEIRDGKVNTYIPPNIRSVEGDITPFLNHVEKLLPAEEDRKIIYDYMAACVQMQGKKFQWCPLIQGVEGNGKTLISTALMNAIGRQYFHMEEPEDLKNPFNAWLERSIVVGVEEIFVNSRYEIANRMKYMITNEWVPIHGKSKDQRSGQNCAKFIMFSNFKDGVYMHRNGRRYAVFFTAQQSEEDLERDGMTEEYFAELWDWMRMDTSKAAVNWWLFHREITTSMFSRAPQTTSTREAVFESLPVAERVIIEAIEAEDIGFRNGIIAANHVDHILRNLHVKGGPKMRSRILENVGYIPMEGGNKGRITIGDQKIKLFIKKHSPLINLSAPQIRELYLKYNHNSAKIS